MTPRPTSLPHFGNDYLELLRLAFAETLLPNGLLALLLDRLEGEK